MTRETAVYLVIFARKSEFPTSVHVIPWEGINRLNIYPLEVNRPTHPPPKKHVLDPMPYSTLLYIRYSTFYLSVF